MIEETRSGFSNDAIAKYNYEGFVAGGNDEVIRGGGCERGAGENMPGPYGGPEPHAESCADQAAGRPRRCLRIATPSSCAAPSSRPSSLRWWLFFAVLIAAPHDAESRGITMAAPPMPAAAGGLLPRDRSGHTDAVWQDHVFPMPRTSTATCGANVSRGTRQRVNAEAAVHRRVDDVIRGLNWMLGRHGPPKRAGMSSAQLEVKELAETRVRRRGGPGIAEPGEKVLRAMTKGRSDYGGANVGAAVASYRLADVSLPDDERDAPFLRQLCSDEARDYLDTYRDSMMRPQAEYDALDSSIFVEPYMDPILRQSRRKYKELPADLDRRGLIYWSATCRE